ncbi:type I-F CRISPR-associated protein Cas7f/Csy3, partial [Escherichia coli]|uniref:type I-F CRISPR-associated protein Cas7f/Csy3 n=1 Tax=Escherichia coli TaxID=562 RepID=UPI0020100A2D
KWDFRLIDLYDILFASATKAGADKSDEQAFRKAFKGFVARAKDSDGLKTVVGRYVRNVVNGRWLWRNRLVAESIVITVTPSQNSEKSYTFKALDYNLNSFDNPSADEQAL